MTKGFYKIQRGWFDDPDFLNEPFTQREAWHWLIENAAFKGFTTYVEGRPVQLDRGEILTSQRQLADHWGWKRKRVRTYLLRLERVKKVTPQRAQGMTLLTLCDYDKYQGSPEAEGPLKGPAEAQQGPIIEERKERKESKDGKRFAAQSAPPTVSEEAQLFERGKQVLKQKTGAGGLIAKLLKAKDGNVALARAAIEIASTKQDPKEYIGAIIRREPTDGDSMLIQSVADGV